MAPKTVPKVGAAMATRAASKVGETQGPRWVSKSKQGDGPDSGPKSRPGDGPQNGPRSSVAMVRRAAPKIGGAVAMVPKAALTLAWITLFDSLLNTFQTHCQTHFQAPLMS